MPAPTAPTPDSVRTVLWTDQATAAMAGDALDAMKQHLELEVVAIGGPKAEAVTELAKRLDAQWTDDARRLVVDHAADWACWTTMQDSGTADLLAAWQAGKRTLLAAPPVTELEALAKLHAAIETNRANSQDASLMIAPLLETSPAYQAAAPPPDAVGEPGEVRGVTVSSVGPLSAGSLFVRLWDAWSAALRWAWAPEVIDASLHGKAPESLSKITGWITAHGRWSSGGSGGGVALQVSDRCGVLRRSMQVLGEAGRLSIGEAGYELHGPTGDLIDRGETDATRDTSPLDAKALPGRRLADFWRLAIEGKTPAWTPAEAEHQRQVLACCRACLLSARTGQPESPSRMLQISGV